MRILTIGESPYILSALSRIHRDMISFMKEKGNTVGAACWNYDTQWFAASDNGEFSYEKDGESVCQVFPFLDISDKASPQLYEIMKKFKPDVVISMSSSDLLPAISSIKSIYPDIFKWAAIVSDGAFPMSKSRKDDLQLADIVIATNQDTYNSVQELCKNVYSVHIPYGADTELFTPKRLPVDGSEDRVEGLFRAVMVCRNDATSNIPAFIRGVAEANKRGSAVEGLIHTDIYDPTLLQEFYDIEQMIEEHGDGCVRMTSSFMSPSDGVSDEKMREIYSDADVVVNCSLSSASGLSALEGMACGCIPMMSPVGAMKDIGLTYNAHGLKATGMTCGANLEACPFIWRDSKEYSVVSSDTIAEAICFWASFKKEEPFEIAKLREVSQTVSGLLSRNVFLKATEEAIAEVLKVKSPLVLEDCK